MEREARDFDRDDGDDDSVMDDFIAKLPPCPGVPGTPEEVAEADARAEADIAAGRVYSHELVAEWLKTWASPDYKPFHDWLAARDG